MADYFLVLEASAFEGWTRPALAAAWRTRDFGPCRALCADLAPAARSYAERYHVGAEAPLVDGVAGGLPFDRRLWRSLTAEVLLYSAVEIPEFQTCEETLCRLLAPEFRIAEALERERLPPVVQAHRGSRDLTFGAAVYRPDHAGYNNAADTARLAKYLAEVRPDSWRAADLLGMEGAEDESDRVEELAFAREWLPVLAEHFRRATDRGWVIVHEQVF